MKDVFSVQCKVEQNGPGPGLAVEGECEVIDGHV